MSGRAEYEDSGFYEVEAGEDPHSFVGEPRTMHA